MENPVCSLFKLGSKDQKGEIGLAPVILEYLVKQNSQKSTEFACCPPNVGLPLATQHRCVTRTPAPTPQKGKINLFYL